MLFEFYRYIKTEFVLLIHYDGFVVNPEMWRSEFLDYDYIGSPWPEGLVKDIYGNTIRVGNSVSIRSKKLLELPKQLNLPFQYGGDDGEDAYICAKYRHIFVQNNIKYAPLEVAKYFGHEGVIPELEGIKPFVFHKWKWYRGNEKYKNFERFHLIRSFFRKLPLRINTLLKRLSWIINRIKQYGLKKAIKYYLIKYIKKGEGYS